MLVLHRQIRREVETRTRNEADVSLARSHMRAHHASQRIAVGQRDGRMTEFRRLVDKLRRV